MNTEKLNVIAVISNPAGFESRYRLYKNFEKQMLQTEGVNLITVELTTPDKDFAITSSDNKNHIQVRSASSLWHKENMINIAIDRLPPEEKYIAWIDADLTFTNPNWVAETIEQLQTNKVVQLFSKCADLDQFGEPMKIFDSFCSQFVKNGRKVPPNELKLDEQGKDNGGIYTGSTFWHSGFAWAATRDTLMELGGVMDFTVMGSGDHLMALSFVGQSERINSIYLAKEYLERIRKWERKAKAVVGKDIGYVSGLIAHHFHGKKVDRGYNTRTQVLVSCGFNPNTDLVKNEYGAYELVVENDRQEGLKEALHNYFFSRNEDFK